MTVIRRRARSLDHGEPEPLDLRETNLSQADLRGANLRGADLSGAYLTEADLKEAKLWEADLREALLTEADLSGADLTEANLCGASLIGTQNLTQEQLENAIGDENTRLLADLDLKPPAHWGVKTDEQTEGE